MSEVSARPYTQRDKDGNALAPRTDASCIAYGVNNVQQVIENIIASGSALYSETSTYAIGAYCNKLGVMYKCTTAITSPEAWNAAHWTATTVTAELLMIIAELSNKTDKIEPDTSNVDLDTLTDIGKRYFIRTTCTNRPPIVHQGHLAVNGFTTGFIYQVYVKDTYDQDSYDQGISVFMRVQNSGMWSDWKRIALSTPPTEYDLPLASGFTAPYGLKYSKNQFGEVTFGGVVMGSFGADLITFATLPAAYRPAHITELPVTGHAGKLGLMRVDANGAVSAILNGDAPYLYMLATFVAGN